MKKLSTVSILALALVLVLGSTVVYAAFHWCPDDPVLLIGGTEVHVTTFVPDDKVDLVKGPVHVKVYVPRNIEASVIGYGDGYGKGEKVVIISNGEPVVDGESVNFEVEVMISATETFPVGVSIGPSEGTEPECTGQSKKWVKCEATLD